MVYEDGRFAYYEWVRPPSIIVIAGTKPFLIRLALDEVVDALRVQPRGITRMSGEGASARKVLVELARQPVFAEEPEILVLDGLDQLENREGLVSYLDKPTSGKVLVAIASSRYETERDKVRWIPTDKRVLYIDCNEVDADQMVKYCMLRGISQEDAETLIVRCGGDIEEVSRNLDLLTIFPQASWDATLLNQITARLGSEAITFGKYAILDTGNDGFLLNQLERRLMQLAVIALLRNKLSVLEILKRVGIEGFIIKQIYHLTKNTTPEEWIIKLMAVERAKLYHAQGMSGVREFVAGYV